MGRRLTAACHNLGHHAASGLSCMIPHVQDWCIPRRLKVLEIDLLLEDPLPDVDDGLRKAARVLRARLERLLGENRTTIADLCVARVALEVTDDLDPYLVGAEVLLAVPGGRTYRRSFEAGCRRVERHISSL